MARHQGALTLQSAFTASAQAQGAPREREDRVVDRQAGAALTALSPLRPTTSTWCFLVPLTAELAARLGARGFLVWPVLDAVEELDLSAFYRDRQNGHGRPAYDPSMMVALLL